MNKWIFIMEMKMDTLMGNEFGKRLDYNEWILDNEWRAKLITLVEQTLNNNGIQNNFDNKNEFNILRADKKQSIKNNQ